MVHTSTEEEEEEENQQQKSPGTTSSMAQSPSGSGEGEDVQQSQGGGDGGQYIDNVQIYYAIHCMVVGWSLMVVEEYKLRMIFLMMNVANPKASGERSVDFSESYGGYQYAPYDRS